MHPSAIVTVKPDADNSSFYMQLDNNTILHAVNHLEDSDDTDTVAPGDRLSPREIEILAGVAQGLLNKEIAAKYNLSIHTVITHRKNIARKTGIKTIAGLTAYAILNNLIKRCISPKAYAGDESQFHCSNFLVCFHLKINAQRRKRRIITAKNSPI